MTVTPNRVRYSLDIERIGNRTRCVGTKLQRSEKLEDGTWIDDPRPGSSVGPVEIPVGPAVAGLIALLPTILSRLGISGELGQFRMHLRDRLDNGVLDVAMHAQAELGGCWINKRMPSINAFVMANLDLAESINAAWMAMDGEIAAANTANGWL